MRRQIELSEPAQRAVDALPSAQRSEFQEILEHLSERLLPLQRAGLVTPSEFFGIDGLRYFDNTFPFLIYFEVVSDHETEREGLLIHILSRASLFPH